MTTLFQTRLPIPAAELNDESTLPLLYDITKPAQAQDTALDEDDELFLDYGGNRSAFPYLSQDNYTRRLTRDGLDAVVLENDHLRAAFIPGLGGKLWSLYDKDENRELLFANHVFRPAYLALRNAWVSGGVEWNCGAVIGHHPYTCSQIHTAMLDADKSGLGCPVLRFYSFERIRAVTQQMDFYLPENAKYLHCRMRVVNDARTDTAMYWWSNIAVKSDENARCVVPADYAFTYVNGMCSKVAVPTVNGVDVTYPTRNPVAIDYFFKTYRDSRHYTSHLGADGYGLIETSTSRLKGRKLFVWGRGPGGKKWQEYLSGDDGRGHYCDGRYCEIQCGLADTQYECLPMPPKTAWEWMEYYGPIHADPKKVHGDWKDAQNEVAARLEDALPLDSLEKELSDTHTMALTPAKVLIRGDEWGALENYRRTSCGMKPLCPHLDFGVCSDTVLTEKQRPWVTLVRTGSLRGGVSDAVSAGIAPPPSYQRRREWVTLLEKAAHGCDRYFWLTHYLLGCAYLADGDTDRAEAALDASCRLLPNAWNQYAMAELLRVNGDEEASARMMLAAYQLAPADDSLCKMTARALDNAHLYPALFDFTAHVTDDQKRLPRIRAYRATAAVKVGELDIAEALLYEDGGLEVPDTQEGEVSLTDLWYELQEKKAARDGTVFDRKAAKPPKAFDFRMYTTE